MERVLKFDIEKAELIKTVSDDELAIMRVFVCHDGNNAHGLPIDLDVIKMSAENSLRGKPILYEYVASKGDLGSHSPSQIPGGYFRENQNFEYVEQDKKTFLVAEAVFWKIYGSKAYELFEQENHRPVSMEIRVLDTELNDEDNLEHITNMSFMGVTILGLDIPEACKGSNVEIVKFSEEVEKTEKLLAEFSSSTNEENLNINNNIDTQEKEVEQMVFNKDEHAVQFSMTANDIMSMMQDACGQMKYQVEDREYSKYWMIDYDADYMYAYNEQDGGKSAIPYSIEDGKVKCDFENVKSCKTMTKWVIMEDTDDDSDSVMMAIAKANEEKEKFAADNKEDEKQEDKKEDEEKMAADNKKEDFSSDEMKEKFTEMETKLNEMEEKFSALSKDNETLKTENEQLKKFESEILEIKNNDKNAKIEFTLQEAIGDGMPKETADEFRTKALEFSAENIHIWVNEVKANALDFVKEKTKENKDDGFVRVGLAWATETEKKNKKSIWS